jgi:chromosome segregation ATPase
MSINNAECPECGRGFAKWDKNDPKTCPDCTIKLQQAEIDRLTADVAEQKAEVEDFYNRAVALTNDVASLEDDLTDLACRYERVYRMAFGYRNEANRYLKSIDNFKKENSELKRQLDESNNVRWLRGDKIFDLESENARLREALCFYADENNYKRHTRWDPPNGERIVWFPVLDDRGVIAKSARGEA